MRVLSLLVWMFIMLNMPANSGEPKAKPIIYVDEHGKLAYTPDESGNRIPDFSRCGYAGGGVALPVFPIRATLEPSDESVDDTTRIQSTIDNVSATQPDRNGIRGAVLLKKGVYRISGTLKIQASGVVLRGEGQREDGTILLGTGTDKRTLIVVGGKTRLIEVQGSRRKITDVYVPWGATSLSLEAGAWPSGCAGPLCGRHADSLSHRGRCAARIPASSEGAQVPGVEAQCVQE